MTTILAYTHHVHPAVLISFPYWHAETKVGDHDSPAI
jgi:hypothetical protein